MSYLDEMSHLCDVFFNGRRAKQTPEDAPKVTLTELISRKKSIIRVGDKLYRVTVEEMEVTK